MTHKEEINVAIIILNWNSWIETRNCVLSIRKSSYTSYNIFVVDNASSDGSVKFLKEWDIDLDIIESGANLGWSGGNNIGIRLAIKNNYDLFFLVNPDILFEVDTIGRIVAAFRQYPDAAAFGSLVWSMNNPDWIEFGNAAVDERSGFVSHVSCAKSKYDFTPNVINVPAVKGCAMAVTKIGIEKIGMLDEEYFLNFDETDWCFRATKKSMEIKLVKDSIVFHYGALSFDGTESPFYRYFIARNRLIFAKKNGLSFEQKIIALRSSLWELKRAVQKKNISLKSKIILFAVIVKAFTDFFFLQYGNPSPVVKRLSDIYMRINPR